MKAWVRYSLSAMLIISVFLVSGCTLSPTEADVRNVIVKDFEERGYRVVDLQLGAINPIPMDQKVFMGTPAYTAAVKSITLEEAGTRGEAEPLTFKNAAVQVKETPDRKGRWIISHISGIPLP